MKRIIRITFFVLVELWFFLTLLIPLFVQPSWGLNKWFSNWVYFLGALLILIVPIHHLVGNSKREWLWVVMYYQLVFLSPFVLLIQFLANE